MTATELVLWLAQSLAVGGGLLLLAVCLLLVVRQPVRRRMIGSAAVRIALLVPLLVLAPKWLLIPVPEEAVAVVQDVAEEHQNEVASVPSAPAIPYPQPDYTLVFVPTTSEPNATTPAPVPAVEPTAAVDAPAPEAAKPLPWRNWLLSGYGLIAGAFFARWLLAQLGLMWVIRRSRPAGRDLREMFERVAASAGVVPELRVVPNVNGPVCCGLRRPVVLLPQRLAEVADEESLRWIFAHELAHLRRGDAWTAFWFGLAESLYFALPWFWWLKRQVRLDQEYVADAEAAGESRAEDYASFLVNLSRSPRGGRKLAAASGVLGSPSELYRRITMLLQDSKRVERSCPRRWSALAVSAFLALAVVLSGVGVARYSAAPLDEPQDKEEKKVEKKKNKEAPKDEKEPEEKPDKPQPNPQPRVRVPRVVVNGDGVDIQELQKQIDKAMEELQKQLDKAGGFQGQFVPAQPRVWRGGNFAGNNPYLFGGRNSSGRLGVAVEKPSTTLVEQLDLPKDQGLVLSEITNDSAAAKAGLKANDILLEVNGKAVSSDVNEFRKQLDEIKADASVNAIVLRKGKRETIKGLKLPEAKAEENRFGNFGGNFENLRRFAPAAPAAPGVPGVPNANVIPVPFPPNWGENFGPGTKSMSVQVNNDSFTIHSRDESYDITLSGKIEDGKKVVNQVKINDGNARHSYDKMDNVPEKYRDKINGLLKNVTVSK